MTSVVSTLQFFRKKSFTLFHRVLIAYVFLLLIKMGVCNKNFVAPFSRITFLCLLPSV